jgi:hypothetical protein
VIDAIAYAGGVHEVLAQMGDVFQKELLVAKGDMVKQHQVLVDLPHVAYMGRYG